MTRQTKAPTRRTPAPQPAVPDAVPAAPRATTKRDLMIDLLRRPAGASLAERATGTGWQPHSIRGAIAGSLKRKGHVITARRIDGVRRYRIELQS